MQLSRDALIERAAWSGRVLLDLVLPPQCPTCDAVVDEPGRFCASCFKRASFIVEPCCNRCGSSFASTAAAGLGWLCTGCMQAPPTWRRARAAFNYDDFSKQLVLPLKYGDRTENAEFLGRHMARAGASLLKEADLLLPVPLHRSRLFSRRYNQAALLARHVGRLARREVMVDGLMRIRATRSLASCAAEERARVIAGAIACRPSRLARLKGSRVVLIDDVLTTGATASACTEVLLRAGVASVDMLVGARAARREHEPEQEQEHGRERRPQPGHGPGHGPQPEPEPEPELGPGPRPGRALSSHPVGTTL